MRKRVAIFIAILTVLTVSVTSLSSVFAEGNVLDKASSTQTEASANSTQANQQVSNSSVGSSTDQNMTSNGKTAAASQDTNSTAASASDGSVSLDDFKGKRLMVGTDNKADVEGKGEILAEYNGVYLIQYATDKEAYQAYQDYKKKADFVDIDRDVSIAANESADSVTEDKMTTEDNPFSDAQDAKDVSGMDIALVDTGASGTNVVKSVSVAGDNTNDDNGHGTAMAKVMKGIAPNAKVLSVKALGDDGKGTMSAVYAAMEYAIESKVKVINLSLSGIQSADSESIEKAVDLSLIYAII